jgi:hypothetical protein
MGINMKKTIIFFLIAVGFIYPQIQQHHLSIIKKRVAAGGNPYVTDSLKYYWLYSDLEDGDITANEWIDQVISKPFTNVDSDPNKSSSGVTFDSNDDMYSTTGFVFTGNVSMEVVAYIPDSTIDRGICSIRSGDYNLGLTLRGNYLNASATPNDGGTNYYADSYSTPAVGANVHIIATWDGSSDLKIYLNGQLLANKPGVNGGTYGSIAVVLGYVSGSFSDGIIKLFRVYHQVLDGTEASQNYNSDSVQNLL